jgi:hypothetical protein
MILCADSLEVVVKQLIARNEGRSMDPQTRKNVGRKLVRVLSQHDVFQIWREYGELLSASLSTVCGSCSWFKVMLSCGIRPAPCEGSERGSSGVSSFHSDSISLRQGDDPR